jgi:hypothetical protein
MNKELESIELFSRGKTAGGRTKYSSVGHRYHNYIQWPVGTHVIHVEESGHGTSGAYSYDIEPDFVAVEAALLSARGAITEAMMDASRAKPSERVYPIGPKERACWDAYEAKARELKIDPFPPTLIIESAAGIVDAGIEKLREKMRGKK